MGRARSRFVSALVMANLLLATLVALEVAARVVGYGWVHWRGDSRSDADGYGGAAWTKQYYDEFIASGAAEWQPYVYWRLKPFAGTFIRVDEHGIRHTWEPAGAAQGARVFVLGGSTVWGTGARDDHTIPSYLARELAQRQQVAQVVNFGESGYVTRQDVLTLIDRLQAGDVPDVAVFYSGINNVFSAFQNGVAGVPQNEANRRREFEASDPGEPLKALRLLTTGTQSIAEGIRRRLLRQAVARGFDARTDAALARAVVADYCADLRTVRALSAEYGFRAVFFWQPVIFTKPVLTPYEQGERDRFNYASGFFEQAYAALRSSGEPCAGTVVRDLSGLFANQRQPVFIDAFHLTETGNEAVARAMVPAVTDAFQVRPDLASP